MRFVLARNSRSVSVEEVLSLAVIYLAAAVCIASLLVVPRVVIRTLVPGLASSAHPGVVCPGVWSVRHSLCRIHITSLLDRRARPQLYPPRPHRQSADRGEHDGL